MNSGGLASWYRLAPVCLWWIATLTGCLPQPDNEPDLFETPTPQSIAIDRLEIVSGNNQAALKEGTLLKPLRVRLLGRRPVNFLGRKLQRKPAAGVEIQFKVNDATDRSGAREQATRSPKSEASAEAAGKDGSEADAEVVAKDATEHDKPPLLYASPDEPDGSLVLTAKTDENGEAQVWAKLGSQAGDWEVEADVPGVQVQRVRFHLAAGVRRVVSRHESVVGSKIQMWLELTPLPARAEEETEWQIVYRVVSAPGGDEEASLKNERDKTNSSGVQKDPTILTLGDTPGVYTVLADVIPPTLSPDSGVTTPPRPFRGILMRFVAMDWVAVGLRLATGLLIFVFGVRLVGSGVLLLMSQKFDLVTVAWTKNRWLAGIGGLLNGAAFQSSSLVTAHLASLSNGGLIELRGSLGLLAGAAVGATLLPQLLALELGGLAAPLLVLGAILLVFRRRTSFKSWAWILLGAGLTLVAWNLLSATSELATLSRKLREVVLAESTPQDGFAAYALTYASFLIYGTIAGFLLRTSNLIVVVAMLLAGDQALLTTSAVPLVLGANLGAAGMVFLTTLRKRREAVRLSLASCIIQVFGVLVVTVLMFVSSSGEPLFVRIVDAVVPRDLLPAATDVEQNIAVAHTLHNALAGFLVFLVPALHRRLTDRLLPPTTADAITPHQLDPQLMEVPALALRQGAAEAIYLTEIGRKTVAEAFDAFRYQDPQLADQVVRRAEMMTGIYRNLSLFLVEVSENQLHHTAAGQLEILQGAGESQVRIGELAERLRDLANRRAEEQIPTNEEADRDLGEAYDLVVAQFGNILSLLQQKDARTEENAAKLVERMAKFSVRVEGYWHQRLQSASTPSADLHVQTFVYREAFEILFLIAERLAHVAQRMRLLTTDDQR